MALTGALIIGGAMAASSAIGAIMSAGDKAAARAAAEKAYHMYDGINIPDIEKQRLALQSPEVQGILQPYMEQVKEQNPSAYQEISTDPRLRQAQMTALDTMSKMGQTGLTSTDQAALNASRRQTQGDAQARQASILQQLAQRGASGGGLELATKLAAAQGAEDQAGQESDRTMSMAQQRMLGAVAQAGQLGGQMEGQQFGEEAQKAQAADAISRFNAQQAAQVQARNIANSNAAQAANLAAKQQIANQGVATANTQQQYNKNLIQQQFNNQMGLASARANAAVGAANQYNAQAGQTANMWAGMGRGVGQMGAAYAMMPGSAGASGGNTTDFIGGPGTGSDSSYQGETAPSYGGDMNTAYVADGGMITNQGDVIGGDPDPEAVQQAHDNKMAEMLMKRLKDSDALRMEKAKKMYGGGMAMPESDHVNAACGGMVMEKMSKGGMAKPLIPGDHPQNDVVHARLSPGEVVIPRSIMQSNDPVGKAADFISSILAKTGKV